MQKKIVFLALGFCVFLLALFLLKQRHDNQVRAQLVSDYLAVIQPMAAFVIELSGPAAPPRPSAYTIQTVLARNQVFQKKYRPYGRLVLHKHNRIEDFLASVNATVRNYVRLTQRREDQDPAAWLKQVQGLHQLFFHNAIYSVMAVGRDKTSLAITKGQRTALLRTLDIHYGGVFYPYVSRPQRPAFIADLLIIKESLESRRPAIF